MSVHETSWSIVKHQVPTLVWTFCNLNGELTCQQTLSRLLNFLAKCLPPVDLCHLEALRTSEQGQGRIRTHLQHVFLFLTCQQTSWWYVVIYVDILWLGKHQQNINDGKTSQGLACYPRYLPHNPSNRKPPQWFLMLVPKLCFLCPVLQILFWNCVLLLRFVFFYISICLFVIVVSFLVPRWHEGHEGKMSLVAVSKQG